MLRPRGFQLQHSFVTRDDLPWFGSVILTLTTGTGTGPARRVTPDSFPAMTALILVYAA
jgi:hypothetical protein